MRTCACTLFMAVLVHGTPAFSAQEEGSAATVKVSGVSTGRPNPLNSTVVFDVSSARLEPRGHVTVTRNGSPLPASSLTITRSRVTVRGGLVDGANKLELEAVDTSGAVIDEAVSVWAGSRTVTVLVTGDGGDPLQAATVRALFDADRDVFAIGATDRHGRARLENLPAKQVLHVMLSAKDYRDREVSLGAVETAATIGLDVDNNDFHLGFKGWEISDPKHVSVVRHSEESRPINEIIRGDRDTPRDRAVPIPPMPPMLTGVRMGLGPIDAAAGDLELIDFREQIRAFAGAEDLVRLASVAETPAALRQALSTPAGWQELRDTLRFGGSYTESRGAVAGRREFCTPYFYSTYAASLMPGVPTGDGDLWVVTNASVPVRAAPSPEAELLGTFEYDVIRVTGLRSPSEASPAWREVFIPDGRRAWVEASQMRSLADYHACFVNTGGRWRVSAFSLGGVQAR
ncbi:MAG: hypothetical protein ABIQ52_02600 [Vicinamibacterales bacterium]